MFILALSIPLFLLSFIWEKFTYGSKVILRALLIITFAVSFTAYYPNGSDWVIYYLKFLDDGEPFLSFEFGFVIFFKFLLFLTGENYGASILIFFLLCFSTLNYVLVKFKANEPLFWGALFVLFGYNLVLEQLRQFIACILVLYAILSFNENERKLTLLVWVIIASSFHVSSLIILPSLLLVRLKNINTFIFITLSAIVGFVAVLFGGYALISLLANINFAFAKVLYYLDQNHVSLNIGWLNLVDAIYVFFYIYYRAAIDANSSLRLFTRLIFVGAIIHLFSGSITFLVRVSFYYYFVALYVFCLTSLYSKKRTLRIQSYNTFILSVFFTGMLFLNFISYFRNEQAPVQFFNLNFQFWTFMNDKHVNRIANEKYAELEKTNSVNL